MSKEETKKLCATCRHYQRFPKPEDPYAWPREHSCMRTATFSQNLITGTMEHSGVRSCTDERYGVGDTQSPPCGREAIYHEDRRLVE